MKYNTLALSALAAFTALAGLSARADNMASIAITPATGVVTLSPHWGLGGNLAGFHLMSQNTGFSVGANNFYSIKGTTIPAGGDIAAFTYYIAGSGAATNHADVGSKLTPNSYSALTSADPDLGFGAVNFYLIHHKGTTDYFSVIVPGSGTSSAVTDLKPMSGPGGPATVTGVSGYFGLTFAATNLGYGLNNLYYLRTDPVTALTKFGVLAPALLGTSADQFDLGTGGHNALTFTGTNVGYGVNKMYYLRLDPITGFTIFGMLDPALAGARHASDIANLGSVYSNLDFVPGDVGFGSNHFYVTGAVNPTWQSVSFAAIADRVISAGGFAVNPSASSALPIVLTVVPGSTGAASITGPTGGGTFTVTPTAPGLITLQATQVGALAPTAYEFNMLRQSFTATGVALLVITTQPIAHSAALGSTTNFVVVASGTSALSYQWRKAGANITGNASATTATLTLTNVQAGDGASYDVMVSNASGSILSDPAILAVGAGGSTPVITSNPVALAGTVGTPFNFTISASNSPTSFAATGLPLGLSVDTATGTISGTPSTSGTSAVLISAANAAGAGHTADLTITVADADAAPIIANNPLTVGGSVGTPFSFTIIAAGSPTSFAASPLPDGLSLVGATGVISGMPTTVGTTAVLLGATNGAGTGTATLTITIATAPTPPNFTTQPVGQTVTTTQGASYTVTAGGSPTPTYQWQRLPAGSTSWENLQEGGSYHGVTTATLTLSSITPAMSGDQFRVVVTSGTASSTSGAAGLTVNGAANFLFQYPASIARDSAGNLYVADSFSNSIQKITPAGVVSTLAGLAGVAGTQDGTGSSARFNQPAGVTVDAAGNVYVSDTGNATIRKITPAGAVTTLAGAAAIRGSHDDLGGAASFGLPNGIALDAAGNLYVGDSFNATIRKITPNGVVSTLAGSAGNRGDADGTGSAARFNFPNGVTVDSSGNVYVADTYNHTIRKILPDGTVTTLAGSAGISGSNDGTGFVALFNQPLGVTVDAAGNVYVADTGNNTIRLVTPAGLVTTIAGVAGIAGLGDGDGVGALFNHPHDLVADSSGNLYIADTGNAVIRWIGPNDVVHTMALTAAPVNTPPPAGGGTTPPAGGGSGTASSGGGGAMESWFVAVLALLGAARLWPKLKMRNRTARRG